MKGLGIRIDSLVTSGRGFWVSVLVCGMIAVGALGCADPEPVPYWVCEGEEDVPHSLSGRVAAEKWPSDACYEKRRATWVCATDDYGREITGDACGDRLQARYDAEINTGVDSIASAEAACTPYGYAGKRDAYALMTERIAGYAAAPSREQWCESKLFGALLNLERGNFRENDDTGWCNNYRSVLSRLKEWDREFDRGRKVSEPSLGTLDRLTVRHCVDHSEFLWGSK